MQGRLDRFFRIQENNSTIKREILAGITTFMTMAYIIIVNPIILSPAFTASLSPDEKSNTIRALVCATCIASAASTLLMGILARYPIALAPGMGMNAIFTYTICIQMNVPWQKALGMVFISGLIFTVLSVVKFREMIINAVPHSLKFAAAAGIGIFIAFIGLKHAGIIKASGTTFVQLGDLTSKPVIISTIGLIITVIFHARKIKGSILAGIIITGLIAYAAGLIEFEGKKIYELPVLYPVFGKLDIIGALRPEYLTAILILLFFDMFDTVGTLIGVSEQAGFLKEDGKLPRAELALLSDATGTMIGAVTGTSTVTSYIESAAGIAEGGRTGLTSITVAILFIIAMFFAPLAQMFGSGLPYPQTITIAGRTVDYIEYLYPITAPALIVVGSLMMKSVIKISWEDWTEAIPAFLTIILMPLTFSISTGLLAGLVLYPIVKLATGRAKEVHWFIYLIVTVFIAGFIATHIYS